MLRVLPFFLVAIGLILNACYDVSNSDLLRGKNEVQYRVEEKGEPGAVYFVFRNDGTWVNHYMNRRDSLVPFEPTDLVHDKSFQFWGDSMYFWDYKWDVLRHDENHLDVKMRGANRIWHMTRTDFPIVAR